MSTARTLHRNRVTGLLRHFNLRKLFVEELGWDHHDDTHTVEVSRQSYVLTSIAEKQGMVAWQWTPSAQNQRMPDRATRERIDREVSKAAHEHLLVFADKRNGVQHWQWIRREAGRPARMRGHEYFVDGPSEPLIDKLQRMVFSLNDERDLTIVEVASRVGAAFDVEAVTKTFFKRFSQEHIRFRGFINGFSNSKDRDWYASIMLNRMMFIYFIQRRGFLANDPDYLKNRLATVQRRLGGNRFHTFYREFLLQLFHKGLGQPLQYRSEEVVALLGDVPYLNGGLFDVHRLERGPEDIHIPDRAFESVFAFFDSYQWHLDDRPLKNSNEINPDVLGYIFEKYINRRESGAYYTKEDVTGYIGRQTIIPRLLDLVQEQCPEPFSPGGRIWRLLIDHPDQYIHEAVQHGTTGPLPPSIAVGIGDRQEQTEWDTVAASDYGLPTESWREHVARREQQKEVKKLLATGAVHEIDQLVTLNLNTEKLVNDIIKSIKDPQLIHAFWKALRQITVLDPTCGSGAFLFGALTILKPIYDACLVAMQDYCTSGAGAGELMVVFKQVLDDIAKHPSKDYVVLKSIVLSNLYGVDIIPEAVETCKLRLFLRLVAELKDARQIEPLPDMDLNIRCGNALVGFTTLADVHSLASGDLLGDLVVPEIEMLAGKTSKAFDHFRELQTRAEEDVDSEEVSKAKSRYDRQLRGLQDRLDKYLAEEYDLVSESKYRAWRESHKPFHWCVEYYGIYMDRRGFDVVIGNPPYVSANKVQYSTRGLICETCPDIYAWVLERNIDLLAAGGRTGMIVPLSLGFNKGYDKTRRLILRKYERNWFSFYGRIPSALFSHNVRVRNTIHIGKKGEGRSTIVFTTRIHRWNMEARNALFETLRYVECTPVLWKYRIPKINTSALAEALEDLLRKAQGRTLGVLLTGRPTEYVLHYKKTAYNWLTMCRELPPCYGPDGRRVEHTKYGKMYCRDADSSRLLVSVGNGKLMLVYWFIVGDDFDVTRWNIAEFPFDIEMLRTKEREVLVESVGGLEEQMGRNVVFKKNAGKDVGNYDLSRCRDTTDVSDEVLLMALGLQHVWDDIELYYSQMLRGGQRERNSGGGC